MKTVSTSVYKNGHRNGFSAVVALPFNSQNSKPVFVICIGLVLFSCVCFFFNHRLSVTWKLIFNVWTNVYPCFSCMLVCVRVYAMAHKWRYSWIGIGVYILVMWWYAMEDSVPSSCIRSKNIFNGQGFEKITRCELPVAIALCSIVSDKRQI